LALKIAKFINNSKIEITTLTLCVGCSYLLLWVFGDTSVPDKLQFPRFFNKNNRLSGTGGNHSNLNYL